MLIMQKNNPNKKKPCTNDKGTDCKRKPIIFFSMKRCVVTDNLYKMSSLLFGHACTPEITKQIHRQKTHVVKCLIVWHGPLILNIVNESVCIVCGRYGHSCYKIWWTRTPNLSTVLSWFIWSDQSKGLKTKRNLCLKFRCLTLLSQYILCFWCFQIWLLYMYVAFVSNEKNINYLWGIQWQKWILNY